MRVLSNCTGTEITCSDCPCNGTDDCSENPRNYKENCSECGEHLENIQAEVTSWEDHFGTECLTESQQYFIQEYPNRELCPDCSWEMEGR